MAPAAIEVVEGPDKRGRVIIRSGPYEIHFAPDSNGHARKIGFTCQGTSLEGLYVPPRYFVPAVIRANVILSDRKKRPQNKLPSHSFRFR
ncbi:MAG: hypothetical protein A2667_00330 [Candidatus Wildermuthbacteria bacterium RIFCSPHIGHO2_01_FULL_47_27]|uniref:Uncharacterized protein n=2 Tax=Candidatus Wildermuthiibacteriota TaxID=1817923 RepID=A0A1G2RTY7_9BACT|nr:MAG: hypothetical protein A2667_00330 [Candidatus Wildermuthbacteria bacterium RIFCSPHIGHO2_01_FULL_47_27]OHA68411.1 MAG: hypothetical protein A3D59_04570 [Candidatus Wildermuthbacteria bacterium RIFCSPHIGHO2_02_FULL_47_17]OHA75849.1 MAG: hypothetical protein A3A32_01760 [Candidatus Wildermuthbacteria bacterium RIFCSPLOWO2_01_FULL_48_35]OHA76393.1 MAG: hypothetical protein A3I38_01440 [Candidatus Wildermuthbacteria bacterium RIFCSPLOWO2_02_FULL_47_10]